MKHGIAPQRSGGDVLVSASAENGRLTIEVSDTGEGFDLAAIRAGHGLDSLVRRLDALFSADARLNVSRRGGPMRRADGAAAIMRLRAYLVDDEPLAIARLTRLLDETGRVEVIGSATDPEEAVEALASAPPDVCFLDIHMPRLNGFEVLARLPVAADRRLHNSARSVRARGVRGELGRLPAEAGRSQPPGSGARQGGTAAQPRRALATGPAGTPADAWQIRCGAPGPSIPSASRRAWAIASGSSIWRT